VLQALVSSFIAGYIRNVELISGVKYAVILSTIALIVWILVTQVSEGGDDAAALLLLLAVPSRHAVCHRVRAALGSGFRRVDVLLNRSDRARTPAR